ncbi:hypothetical protein ACH4KU_23355 [Streptomyces althioticus]|uniref:hypothetical protein n=1 Tax=Streptomyces althioticus TaxID=83380 RepID=UPI0037AD3334
MASPSLRRNHCTTSGSHACCDQNRITHEARIGAYGSGAKPQPAGAGQVTDVVRLADQEYWEIADLDISNKGDTAATRRGVHITRTGSGTGTYYRIRRLDVHDVNGNQTKKDDDASAGTFFEVLGHATPTRFDDVVVENNTVRTVDHYGIHFWTRWMQRPELNNPNCGSTCGTWTPQTPLVIRGNTVTDIGGDAIVPHHTDGALVEHNRVDGFREREPAHCAAGIWGWNTNRALYQFNEVSGGKSECDGQGLDIDEGNIGTVYQYNYSHDNEGASSSCAMAAAPPPPTTSCGTTSARTTADSSSTSSAPRPATPRSTTAPSASPARSTSSTTPTGRLPRT